MTRLLYGLATDHQLDMNYFITTWYDRSKATATDVFKVGLKLIKDLGNGEGLLQVAAGIGKIQRKKQGGDKCSKHSYLFHKWEKCDLNPNTSDHFGRDKGKDIKMARTASGDAGRKQGQGFKSSRDD